MNNSELSIGPSSEDAFAPSQTYEYRPPLDNYSNECAEDEVLFHNRYHSRVTEVESEEAIAIQNGVGLQEAKVRWPEAEHADLGLWLLHGSTDRHDQWERLRRTTQGNVKAPESALQYPSSVVKRGCDLIGSLIFLIVLFPLFVLVAVLIKLDSPGPIFFRHYRVGKDGKQFMLWKFRSMRTEVPRYEASPRSVEDARLTRVGRLIRRLSIDELPQLINVLRGEMSLVGPRPEMPFIVAQYHPVECERLIAKPGITGLWQISPARAFPIHENLQYDLHYIRNQSFILDCVIILRTIGAIVHGVGAI